MSTARIPDGTPGRCPVCGHVGHVIGDLFSGAGGAGMGYWRAGWHPCGIDNRPQPRYPFCFIQADAMSWPLAGFDAIHASPPCQDYSRAMRHLAKPGKYPRLLDPMRTKLIETGRPWVLENVPGSPLPHQSTLDGAHGIELCGTMFGRSLWRHRLFETSWQISAPRGCDHSIVPTNRNRGKRPGGRSSNREWREALGSTWMTTDEADESIPWVYTEYIGGQLLEHMGVSVG